MWRPIVCPYCGADRPRVRVTKDEVRYYRCRRCDLDGTGGTEFKIPVGEPAAELRQLSHPEARRILGLPEGRPGRAGAGPGPG